jgi:hypothetical protein
MSSTPDSALADLHQTIADLQRQLVERTAERDEALARETATAEVLQVINSRRSSAGIRRDTRAALRLCNVNCCNVRTYDSERSRFSPPPVIPSLMNRRVFMVRGNPSPERHRR